MAPLRAKPNNYISLPNSLPFKQTTPQPFFPLKPANPHSRSHLNSIRPRYPFEQYSTAVILIKTQEEYHRHQRYHFAEGLSANFIVAGTTGCWTRVEPGTGRLEPLGASQELRLDKVLYQEAGEYRCVTPNRDTAHRHDSLRSALSVDLIVNGEILRSVYHHKNWRDFRIYVCGG